MTSNRESNLPARDDIDTKSIYSMQELDPSPVDESFPDADSEDYSLPKYQPPSSTRNFEWSSLGLRGQNWDAWLSAIQRYSTYPPTLFATLHFANTSLIPLATRSVPKSDNYLLLTRPIYQAPVLEHVVLTIPILAHIASGIALRNIRSSRRARLYGAETRDQRHALSFWPRMSLQARLGYAFAPLLATHVLVNRMVPVMVEGGSSGVGLGFVAHGIARSRVFWFAYYHIFVFVGVYHIIGGLAAWMGWRITTTQKPRGSKKGSLEGHLGPTESEQHVKRRKRMWWNFNKVAALGACVWLAGALWIIGNGGEGVGWEAKGWNEIYSQVPIWNIPRTLTTYLTFRSAIFTLRVPARLEIFDHTRRQFHDGQPLSRCLYSSPSTMATIPAPNSAGQLVQHNGKEYQVIKEGRAYILKPPAETAATQGNKQDTKHEESQSVFYNPIQQFNRDLTVLAIRVYGDHVMAVHKRNSERRKRKASGGPGGRNKKRKRGEDESEAQKPGGADGKLDNELKGAEAEGEQTTESFQPNLSPPQFTILDALSASGLRALRYASEIPFVTRVVANDLSSQAIQSMKQNIEYNGLENLIQTNNGDARLYMYSRLKPVNTHKKDEAGKFDVIDLDPYGTAAPFLDAAVQGIKDEGLLCVTCTDAGVWASNGYPEKAFSLYGGVPIKGAHSHEGGLRLILNAVATAAAKYGLSTEPLLSLSIDYYARLFVRIRRSPAEVKFTSGNTMLVYNCDSGCGAWTTQPLTQTKQKLDKKGNPLFHFGVAQAPTANTKCEHCNAKTHLSGPMWAGPLHNPHFVQKILDLLPQVDKEVYQTKDRIEGMLTTALEEDLTLELSPKESQNQSPAPALDNEGATNQSDELLPIIPRANPALREPYPLYFTLSSLSKVLHTTTVPEEAFRGALRGLGYKCTRSHAKPNTVRTDAPWAVIWEIMREWVRQEAPIKEGALKPGSPGATIMSKSRQTSTDDSKLSSLKKELISAAESGKDLSDLITKVEAALYRSGARQTLPTSNTDATESQSHPQSNGSGKDQAQTRTHALETELKVVFDESLGQEPRHKRLVRYQLNPRANWGPLSRASS
ncbi:N2,N2-dimethylguanosine tRNA methyltransferase [Aspergillus granulosus]|uniref:tRNA (guanine(26)-N(2))-dimethyltransferase n=1 Tax=Aspergillus granulosus TaxID=176169 RepID=A0ABR4HN02_9EURO